MDKYEAEHIKRIIAQDKKLQKLFADFCAKAGFILKDIVIPSGGKGLWKFNPQKEVEINNLLDEFRKKYKAMLEAEIRSAWELAEQKNDSFLMKILKAAGKVIAGSQLLKWFNRIGNPDEVTIDTILDLRRNEAVEEFIKNRFKHSLSERVWNLAGENKQLISMYLQEGLSTGRSAAGISQDIRKFLNEPNRRFRRIKDPVTGKYRLSAPAQAYHPGQGVYRSSYKNALRVSRTETNMAYRLADQDRWKKLDMILGYEVKLSGNHPKPDICDQMIGQYPKTFSFSGWHSNCFCYTVPVMMKDEDFIKYLETDKVPEKLKVKGLPPEAGRYVKKISPTLKKMENKPYWLDNFTLKEGKYLPKMTVLKPK